MSQYTEYINDLSFRVNKRIELESDIFQKTGRLSELETQFIDMLEALQLLSVVSDDTTKAVLDYITSVINKALKEIFPYDTRRVSLEKKLHGEAHTHIVVVLEDGAGHKRSLTLQSGTGLRQMIAFLFNLSLIEVRKGRRIVLMDELLSGVHEEAKKIIIEFIKIFAEEGFQFVLVEYGVNDLGKVYLVEKPSTVATITPLNGVYKGQIFEFNKPENYIPAEGLQADISLEESV